MRRLSIIVLLLTLGWAQMAAAQTTITVGQGVGYDYATVQAAIDAATTGDVIIVHPGIYYENVHLRGKSLTLRSTEPTSPAVVASTIIDGQSTGSVVTFAGTETSSCILSGLTIQRGRANQGGGIVGNGAGAVIENNQVRSNFAVLDGGGLYRCNGTIQNNMIWGNSGGGGGGGLARCDGTIQNNTIWGNSASYSGGGLFGCSGTVINCIVWANMAGADAQIGQSSLPRYCCIQGWTGGGVGNISQDPRLLDPANGDFHLRADSPCIDAGGTVPLQTDFEGDVRPLDGSREARGDGSDIDIGADECTLAVSSEPPATPVNLSPEDGASGVDIQPTLAASPFADPDGGDTHGASQWQVRRADSPNDYSQVVFDSGPTATDLTSVTVQLDLATDYFWRVRYGDHRGTWSEWSDETGFSTRGPHTLTVGKTAGYDFSAIQAAIDAATISDTILVFPGIYTENIQLRGKRITVRSTNPANPATVASTVIDGNRSGWVVRFSGTETSGCVLAGFTICNGGGYDPGYGIAGGIRGDGTLATIQNNAITSNVRTGIVDCNGAIVSNTVRGNRASYGGGLSNCNGTIRGNIVCENTATFGGGFFACNGTIRENAIYRNSGSSGGGGLWDCQGVIEGNTIYENWASGLGRCNGTIRNNVIVGNTTWYSGAGLSECNGTIHNNTIVDNWAALRGGGIYASTGTITNCILWGNRVGAGYPSLDSVSTPTYSCLQGWPGGGEGNITAQPLFVDANGPDDDPNTFGDNDYRLKFGSPCIDAGNPAAEHNDARRPPGLRTERNDMGAYGGPYNGGWPSPPTIDLTGSLSNVWPSHILPGQQITLSGAVSNQGDRPSLSGVSVEFWAIDAGSGWSDPLCDAISVGPLAAGQSFDLASLTPQLTPYDDIPPGTYVIEMRIDVAGAVAEWDETNNTARWQSLGILADLPNLSISSFNFAPESASPDGGTTMTFWGVVQNTGTQPTSAPFRIDVRVWRNFEPPGVPLCDSYLIEQTFDPGRGTNLALLPAQLTYPLPEGIYGVGVILDPFNQVAEQREDDNFVWLPQRPLYVGLQPLRARSWPLYR